MPFQITGYRRMRTIENLCSDIGVLILLGATSLMPDSLQAGDNLAAVTIVACVLLAVMVPQAIADKLNAPSRELTHTDLSFRGGIHDLPIVERLLNFRSGILFWFVTALMFNMIATPKWDERITKSFIENVLVALFLTSVVIDLIILRAPVIRAPEKT